MKEREKCKKKQNEPSSTSMRQMVLEIIHFEVRNLGKMDIVILWFSASLSLKYDVIDAMLQDNEKMKAQYLRRLLSDLLETLQAVRTWQRNFKFRCYGNQNQNYCLLLKKTKGLLFKKK